MSSESSVNAQTAELTRPSFQSVCEDARDGQADADSGKFIEGQVQATGQLQWDILLSAQVPYVFEKLGTL